MAPEGAKISNSALEGATYTWNMVVVKWSYTVENKGYKVVNILCDVSYKGDNGSIVPWSGMEPYAKMNLFTWPRKDDDWIFPGDQYNMKLEN